MSSDDDSSDDDLLLGSGLGRRAPTKAAERTLARQNSLLDSALEQSKRMCLSAQRVSEMKNGRDAPAKDLDDQLRAQAESLTKKYKEDKKKSKDLDRDNVEIDLSGQDPRLPLSLQLELAKAAETVQSQGWGLREIISFRPKACSNMTFFASQAEAIKALTTILKRKDENGCPPLEDKLRMFIENGILDHFLSTGPNIALILKKHNVSRVRDDILDWLKAAIQSSGAITNATLMDGAMLNLEVLVKDGFCPRIDIPVSQLATELAAWVPSSKKPPPSSTSNGKSKAETNTTGLVRLLRYWVAVLKSSLWEPPPIEVDDAANALICLSLLGIDVVTSSSSQTLGMRKQLSNIFPPLLDLFSAQMGEKYQQCLDRTIQSLVDIIPHLGPGKAGTDDDEDTEAHLCHSVALLSIPYRHVHDGVLTPHRLSCQYKIQLAMGAIEGISKGGLKKYLMINKEPPKPNAEIGKWTISAFDTAVASLKFLNSLGDGIGERSPLVPAVAECVMAALTSGILLLGLDYVDGKPTSSQKAFVENAIGYLEGESYQLTKRTKGMSTNPHMRRLDSLFSMLHQYFPVNRKRKLGGGTQGKKQTDVRGFFKQSNGDNDTGDQSHDTDDDDDDDSI